MDKDLAVKISKKNESSLCLILLASFMLTAIGLLAVLPPVANRHHFDKYVHVTSGEHSDNESDGKQDGGGHAHIHPASQDSAAGVNAASATTGSSQIKPTAATTAATAQVDENPVVVQTQYGAVRGIREDGVVIFHGVPYAQPPVGDLRWKPPQPPTSWSPHEYDATWRRPGCPQSCSLEMYCPAKTSEDCLYLEIYAPAAPDPQTPLRPVMLYIHGGSFRDMSATSPALDAAKFVGHADVITVMVEYRLGILGFLVTGKGEGHATGNYGIQDQRQAIIWVRDNILAFGGDPDKVTLAGQSAGGQSALIHMTSQDISRHFRHVIVESPPLTLRYKTASDAALLGERLFTHLRCSDVKEGVDMDCLKTKGVDEILKAQEYITGSTQKYMDRFETWGPIIDNDIIKLQTFDALRDYGKSTQNMKPMIWGETSEEALIFIKNWFKDPVSQITYKLALMSMFSDTWQEVEKLYPATHGTDAREDMSKLGTDTLFRCPIRWSLQQLLQRSRSGEGIGVWSYVWDHPLDDVVPIEFADCNGRVCHGVEIPYMFQSFSKVNMTPSKDDLMLSNLLMDYYANFIKFGNPNGRSKSKRQKRRKPKRRSQKYDDTMNTENEAAGLPFWPKVNSGKKNTELTQLVFTRTGRLEERDSGEDELCGMWDSIGYAFSFR